jgi:hypothetical protein
MNELRETWISKITAEKKLVKLSISPFNRKGVGIVSKTLSL